MVGRVLCTAVAGAPAVAQGAVSLVRVWIISHGTPLASANFQRTPGNPLIFDEHVFLYESM